MEADNQNLCHSCTGLACEEPKVAVKYCKECDKRYCDTHLDVRSLLVPCQCACASINLICHSLVLSTNYCRSQVLAESLCFTLIYTMSMIFNRKNCVTHCELARSDMLNVGSLLSLIVAFCKPTIPNTKLNMTQTLYERNITI